MEGVSSTVMGGVQGPGGEGEHKLSKMLKEDAQGWKEGVSAGGCRGWEPFQPASNTLSPNLS